jgi:hypothetical protein
MNTLLVIAVGSKYTDLLINNYKYLLNRVEVVVYTDDKEKLNKAIPTADIRVYKESTFRYFDKYTLTHRLTKEKRSAVLYVDVGRISTYLKSNQFIFFPKDTEYMYTDSNWGGISNASFLSKFKVPYLEDGYFNNILEYFKDNKIDPKDIVPLLERIFIIPFNKTVDKVIIELEKVRELFENNSRTKSNAYTGVGNGEGLALGYALLKTDYKNRFLRDVPTILTPII